MQVLSQHTSLCALVIVTTLPSNALVVLITGRVHLGLIRRFWAILTDILGDSKTPDVFHKNVIAAIIIINKNVLTRGKTGALRSWKYNLVSTKTNNGKIKLPTALLPIFANLKKKRGFLLLFYCNIFLVRV